MLEALDDPHVSARGLIQSIDDVALIGHPVGFSTTPPTIRLAPPGLGEHTDAVLRDRLGLSADAIARLRRSRAVG